MEQMSLFPDLVPSSSPEREAETPKTHQLISSGNPLDVTCPECGAQPGEKCKNYLGKACVPHGLRRDACQGEQPDPYTVACPTCGAIVGAWCKRPSGHSGSLVAPHTERIKAARRN